MIATNCREKVGNYALAIAEARVRLRDRWWQEYNRVRPHSALGHRPRSPDTILPLPSGLRSIRITHLSWGRLDVGGRQSFKDAKLFPGGAREWDFPETGTNHVPGIQPADVEELLQHGVPVVVLSKGIYERLQVCPETLQMLKIKGIPAYILQTEDAVRRYNELGEKERVGVSFTRPAKQTARRNPMRRQACRLSGIGVALGLVMYWAPVALAEIREVRLGVEGMCPECATELEEALSRVEGVATVQVSVEPPQARLTLKAGQPLEVAKLRRAVAGVELTPTWIRFEALGVLTIREGTPGFRVHGTAQVITLASDRKLEELMATVRRDCEVVLIEGLISPGEATARIERFEVRGLLIC